MNTKQNNCESCEPCDEQFQSNIDQIVNEGTEPTSQAHNERQEQINSAFDPSSEK